MWRDKTGGDDGAAAGITGIMYGGQDDRYLRNAGCGRGKGGSEGKTNTKAKTRTRVTMRARTYARVEKGCGGFCML